MTHRSFPTDSLPGPAFRFPYGPPKNSDADASEFFGDPYGNRTHVTAVKGRCLNRLTNGPGSGNLVRTDDKPGMNRVLYQLSYTAKSIVSSTAMNSFVIIQDKPPFVKRKMKYFSPFWHRQGRSEPLLPKIPVIARHEVPWQSPVAWFLRLSKFHVIASQSADWRGNDIQI